MASAYGAVRRCIQILGFAPKPQPEPLPKPVPDADLETVDIAIVAAETGHLVLSSLHTVDPPETITRIVAAFPEHQREQVWIVLANVLRGVVSQRLIRNSDKHGRMPAVEVLVGSARGRECIEKNRIRDLHEVMAKGANTYGMQTFDQSLLSLLAAGITHREALEHCTKPGDFELQARGINVGALREFQERSAVENGERARIAEATARQVS